MAQNIDISIVVNASKEGLILEATLNSVKVAQDYLNAHKIKCEVIVILDNSDELTQNIVTKFINSNTFCEVNKIHVEFKSLGKSRNFAVENCQGEYIGFVDGDDLISENWFYKSYLVCRENESIICHPEYNLYFEREYFLWKHMNQNDSEMCLSSLFYFNYWTALSFSKKCNYLNNKYHEYFYDSGYGYEDWHWNCETIATGKKHIIVEGTVHFIRLKRIAIESYMHNSKLNSAIIPRSNFFSYDLFIKQLEFDLEKNHFNISRKMRIKFIIKSILINLNNCVKQRLKLDLIVWLKNKFFKKVNIVEKIKLPLWLETELNRQKKIESNLLDFEVKAKYVTHKPSRYNILLAVQYLLKQVSSEKFEIFFIKNKTEVKNFKINNKIIFLDENVNLNKSSNVISVFNLQKRFLLTEDDLFYIAMMLVENYATKVINKNSDFYNKLGNKYSILLNKRIN